MEQITVIGCQLTPRGLGPALAGRSVGEANDRSRRDKTPIVIWGWGLGIGSATVSRVHCV
jgi:hypothetical protein